MRPLKKKKPLPSRISDMLEDYAIHLKIELGRAKNTLESYLGDVGQFCEFAAERGAQSLADVDADTIAMWLGDVCKSTKSTTQSRKISAVHSLGLFLVDEGIWEKNLSDMMASVQSCTSSRKSSVLSASIGLPLMADISGTIRPTSRFS